REDISSPASTPGRTHRCPRNKKDDRADQIHRLLRTSCGLWRKIHHQPKVLVWCRGFDLPVAFHRAKNKRSRPRNGPGFSRFLRVFAWCPRRRFVMSPQRRKDPKKDRAAAAKNRDRRPY